MLIFMDDYEKAYQFSLKAEKIGGSTTRVLSRKAYYLRMLEKYEEALELYKTIDRNDAWILNEFGYCYSQLEDYDLAIDYYSKALSLDPKNVFSLTKISWVYGNVKEHHLAIEHLKRCLEVTEPTAWLYGQFAYNYYHISDSKKAKEFIKKALELAPNDEWLNVLSKKINKKGGFFRK